LLPEEKVLLKIDAQGYEHTVLKGASDRFWQVDLIECELSFVPLYDGQLLFPQMIVLLKGLGFEPVQFVPGFVDSYTGHNFVGGCHLLQIRKNRMYIVLNGCIGASV